MKTFFINGEIGWNITADKMKNFLVKSNGEDIAVVISSPGGSVFDAFDIKNLLFDYKGKITFVFGSMVASAASYIASIKNSERIVRGNTVWLHHNVSMITWGDYRVLRKDADFIEELTNIIANDYVDVSGKDKKKIRKEMDESTWLFGEEIVKEGFATRIASNDEKFDFIEYDEVNKEADIFQFLNINKDILIKNCKTKVQITEEKCKKRFENNNEYVNKIEEILNKAKNSTVNNSDKGVIHMDLNEFLNQSEEHRTAFNILVTQKVKEGIDNFIKNAVDIMELSNVALPEIALNAIKNNKSVAEFAVDELKAQKKSSPSDYGKFVDNTNKIKNSAKTDNQKKELEDWDRAFEEAKKNKVK